MSEKLADRLALLLFFILVLLPTLAGFGYSIGYSFGLTGMVGEAGFTLTHWKAVLTWPAFWRSIGFSLWCAFASMSLATVLALWIGLGRPRAFFGKLPARLFFIPLALPPMVVGLFLFLMLSKGGLLARIAYQFGLIDALEAFPDFINDPWGIGIILAHTAMAVPFLVLLFGQTYHHEKIDRFADLAATLGGTPQRTLLWVTVPILFRATRQVLMLYALFVVGSYEIPLLLGVQTPAMISVLTLQKLQRFNLLDIPQAYAISAFYMVCVALLVWWLSPNTHQTLTRK